MNTKLLSLLLSQLGISAEVIAQIPAFVMNAMAFVAAMQKQLPVYMQNMAATVQSVEARLAAVEKANALILANQERMLELLLLQCASAPELTKQSLVTGAMLAASEIEGNSNAA